MKRKKVFWMILTWLLPFVFLVEPAFCASYYVPDDFPTIQQAVDATWGGDTVIVRAGTYTGEGNKNITINKVITVRSESGPEDTIIDCEGDGRGFYFANVSNSTVLDGFKIINGSPATSSGGGIYCNSASPQINNCIISGNRSIQGGGIYGTNSYFLLTNCAIFNNSASNSGGGIYSNGGSPSITNCAIINNSTTGTGGGIFSNSGSPSLMNCTLAWNSAQSGGGIYSNSSYYTIHNTIFYFDAALQEISRNGGSITITYSNIQGGYAGEGNIDENPEFVTGGDFHLSGASPCIDTATPENAPDTDLDDELRPAGEGYDMGADEFDGIPAPQPSKADLNNDGVVDGLDVAIVAAEFGSTN